MSKRNLFIIGLFAVAIAQGTQLTASSYAQTEDSLTTKPSTSVEPFNNSVASPSESQVSKVFPWAMGLTGSLILGFLFYNNAEKRRRRPTRRHEKVDRYQEEFILKPYPNQSTQTESTATPQTEKTSSSKDRESADTDSLKTGSSNDNPLAGSLSSPHNKLIEQIVQEVLQKQIRSPDFIYHKLVRELDPNTSEIFETCLMEKINTTQSQLAQVQDTPQLFAKEKPEIEKARLDRHIKALQSIQSAWERWLNDRRSQAAVTAAVKQIRFAAPKERLSTLIQVIDPNQTNPLTLAELKQVAKFLAQEEQSDELISEPQEIDQIAIGITKGIESYEQLQDILVGWLYEPTARQRSVNITLSSKHKQRDPWAFWSKKIKSPILQKLFQVLAEDGSVIAFASAIAAFELSIWTELLITLQFLQKGMVQWFEKQPYDSRWGTASCIATYLTWACIWCQFSNGVQQTTALAPKTRELLKKDCLQVTLQIVRVFSHQSYFPLYGGVFALFSRDALQDALKYLDEPLQKVEGTQEKARFLTLLGYSQQFIGKTDAAIAFHQQALEIAQHAGDHPCQIANFNHLSRIYLAQKNYSEAINYSQRALVLARQQGDRLGEANALANLGYSEVREAQQLERLNSETYDRAIGHLERGQQLSQNLGDRQSQAICCNSLGIAHLIMQQPHTAVSYLLEGAKAARESGDLYLQGLNFNYLAEAYYALNQLEQATFNAFLAMYFLEQISAKEWQQPAGLLIVIQGKQEVSTFPDFLSKHRSAIAAIIGIDGYDYLLPLWEKYKN